MRLLFILLTSIFTISCFGQTKQLENKGERYFFDGKEYKCKELGEVYKTYQVSLDLYNEGRKKKRVARNMAFVGLGLIAGGVGVGLAVGDIPGAVIAGLSIAGGIAIELIALAPRALGNSKLRKARKEFNYEMIRRHGYKSDTSLSISVTQNGVGFVMSF